MDRFTPSPHKCDRVTHVSKAHDDRPVLFWGRLALCFSFASFPREARSGVRLHPTPRPPASSWPTGQIRNFKPLPTPRGLALDQGGSVLSLRASGAMKLWRGLSPGVAGVCLQDAGNRVTWLGHSRAPPDIAMYLLGMGLPDKIQDPSYVWISGKR